MRADILNTLNELGIPFELFEHPAVFTNAESEKLGIGVVAQNTKNLFLSDDKDNRFYLLTIQHGKKADLKKFKEICGEKNLHFANEKFLLGILGLTPGSVTPLGLINDTTNRVKFYLDADLAAQSHIHIHPNRNTATVKLTIEDFKKFLAHTSHTLNIY